MTKPSVAIVATVHNRRAETERMIRSLTLGKTDADLRFFIVDDGSTDGTAELLDKIEPRPTVIIGDGNLFWAGGMRVAIAAARAVSPTYFLLVNDDVSFDPDALARLLDLRRTLADGPTILVGATRDGNATSYGGFRRVTGLGIRLVRVEPNATAASPIDTFNANCLLVDRAAMDRLDGFDPIFTHALADLDFGLRARALGIALWLAPGHVGDCAMNPRSLLDGITPGDWRGFVRKLGSPKGLPPREWAQYNRRHGGLWWALPFAVAYLNLAGRFARKTWSKT